MGPYRSMTDDDNLYKARLEAYFRGVGHVDHPSIHDHLPDSDFASADPLLRVRAFVKTVSGTSHLMEEDIDVCSPLSVVYRKLMIE